MRTNRSHRTRRPVVAAHSLDRSGAMLLVLSATAILAVLLLVLAATPARADGTRTLTGDYTVGQARRLELGIAFGELRVEGTDGPKVRVRVEASCGDDDDDDCERFLERLRLESSNHGGTLHVKLEPSRFELGRGDDNDDEDHGWGEFFRRDRDDNDKGNNIRHSKISVVVEVPRALQVELNMGAGEVNVRGLRKNLTIDLGAGEVSVWMMERHVGKVDVNMAIGETTIHQGGKTREYTRVLGGPVQWREGRGDAGIAVNIGAGEVDVTLE